MQTIRTIFIFILVLTFSAMPVLAKSAGKIGYINLSRAFDEYYKTIEYDKTLEAKHKDFEKQRNEKVNKIREAQGKTDLLKEDEKGKLQKEIEQMKTDLSEFDRKINTDLTKERNEMTREILLEIEKVVSDFAEKESYSIILNDRVLIYGDQEQDINLTEQILSILNNKGVPK